MRMTSWCLMTVLGVSLMDAGCNIGGTSTQEDLGRGIVRGTLGAQPGGDVRLAIPGNAFALIGQVTAVEGGAYVLQEASGIERRVAQMKILESIDRPMSEIGLKLSWMTKDAQSSFGTSIMTTMFN